MNDKIIARMLIISVVVTVLSQIEMFGSTIRALMLICWVGLFFLTLVSRKWKIKVSPFNKLFISCYVIFSFYCSLFGLLGFEHLSSNYLRIMIIPLMVSIIGDNIADEDDNTSLILNVLKAYVISSVVFALYINITYFFSYSSWLAELQYVYDAKNSAGQIWGMAILAIIFVIVKQESRRILWYGMAVYLLIMLGMSQCRTTILALAVILILVAFKYSKHKFLLLSSLIAVVVVALNIPTVKDYIDHALLLSRYKGTDLDAFSSGRLSVYAKAIEEFFNSPIIGTGKWYVDCSYLCVLAESGVIGFVLIEGIWANRIYKNLKTAKKRLVNVQDKSFVSAITIFYIVESVLEGYPPFGPGSSSFCFWLMCVLIVDNCWRESLLDH